MSLDTNGSVNIRELSMSQLVGAFKKEEKLVAEPVISTKGLSYEQKIRLKNKKPTKSKKEKDLVVANNSGGGVTVVATEVPAHLEKIKVNPENAAAGGEPRTDWDLIKDDDGLK